MQINFENPPKTYVVINPVSGMRSPDANRERIQSALQAHHVPFEIYETTGKEYVTQVVREAVQRGFELFLAVGGMVTLLAVCPSSLNYAQKRCILWCQRFLNYSWYG